MDTVPNPSWRLKLHRAEEHLASLEDMFDHPKGRNPCPVTESFNADGQWEYRIAIPFTYNEMAPVVAGECLFNIRSALDHLLCALIPSEDKRHAQFPIFDRDPLAKSGVAYVEPNAAKRWRMQTKGVPAEAVAALKDLQPYHRAGDRPETARFHALAVLRDLQNADKHRRLTIRGPGLHRSEVTANGVTICHPVAMYDGTVVAADRVKMDVKVEGAISVAFSIGNEVGHEFGITLNMVLNYIANEVLPSLEPLLPTGIG